VLLSRLGLRDRDANRSGLGARVLPAFRRTGKTAGQTSKESESKVRRSSLGVVSRAFAALCAAALLVALAPALASAAPGIAHVHSASFSVPDTPISIAVDDSTGSIYVLGNSYPTTPASAAGRIYKYDFEGNPSNFSSLGSNTLNPGCTIRCRNIAVDNSGLINQGVIYLGTTISENGTGPTTKRGVRVYLPNGRPSTDITAYRPSPELPSYCGVAVDPQGVLYNAHPGNQFFPAENAVGTYKPGQILPDPYPEQIWPLLAKIQTLGITGACRMAIDSESRMYLGPNTFIYESTDFQQAKDILRYTVDPFVGGEPSPTLVDTGSTGHAVDQFTNDLYSNHGTSITRFNEEGEPRETFGLGHLADSGPIAVNGANGTVYAGDRATKTIQVFSMVVTPGVTATSAEAFQTTAGLSASVDAAGAGDITGCDFEYGPTTAYVTTVPCAEATPYSGAQDVSASLSSLSKETTYHYRVVVTNSNGTTQGPDRTFTTHNVAGVTTDAPTGLTQTGATLNGSFVGNGEATTYYFEWGTTDSYGNTTAAPPGDSAGSPVGPSSVSAPITGLSMYLADSTPYHYRLVAVNSSGPTLGPDRAFFSAPPDAPEISGTATIAVTPQSASISALINPRGAPSVYWIEYGTTQSYGSSTLQSASVGDDETGHAVTTDLTGLTPGTTYHYRVVASNFGGATSSANQTVNTPAAPVIESVSSSGIGHTAATLEARINPGFRPTTYRFEYGLTSAYGASTPETGLGAADNVPQLATAGVGSLRPGVIYHYRVVATNAEGIVAGADQSLTTVPLPPQHRPDRSKQQVRNAKWASSRSMASA
jgi:hypothetical protein